MSRKIDDIGLFISDIDGTLVDHDKALSDATVEAIARLTDAGIAASLISARPISGMMWIVEKLRLKGPFAAFNGGTLFDAKGAIVNAAHLDDDLSDDILTLIGTRCEAWLFTGGQWYAQDGSTLHSDHERKAASQEPDVRHDLRPLAKAVDKLVAVSDDSDLLDTIEREAHARFEGRANIVRSQTYYLDFTAPTANKGDGVAALAHSFGVDLAHVAVAGDMYNDLPMFERAGYAIAMGQAPDKVREAADMVSISNDEDGVAHAIDRMLAGDLG